MKKSKYIFIMCVIILSIFMLRASVLSGVKYKYERLEMPTNFIQPTNTEDFNAYILEFLEIMLPEYEFIELSEFDRSDATWGVMSVGKLKGTKTIVYNRANSSLERVTADNRLFSFYIYDLELRGNLQISNFLYNEQGSAYADGDIYVNRDNMSNEVCPGNSSSAMCATYINSFKDTCALSAINGQFQFSGMQLYCPNTQKFILQEHQIVNYLMDGFLLLEIPHEFSKDFIDSKQ